MKAYLYDLFGRVAQWINMKVYMSGYSAGYNQGYFEGWVEHGSEDGADFDGDEMLGHWPAFEGDACRVCGCTQNRACVDERGPCWWVEAGLCSHCQEPAEKAVS